MPSAKEELVEFLHDVTGHVNLEERDDEDGITAVGIVLTSGKTTGGGIVKIGDNSVQLIDPASKPGMILRYLVPFNEIACLSVAMPGPDYDKYFPDGLSENGQEFEEERGFGA